MRYKGGKSRIANPLIEAMGANERPDGTAYVEPFCGGCSVARGVKGRRILADKNRHVVEMWRALVSGWVPPAEVSAALRQYVKLNPDRDPALTAFVNIAASFGGEYGGSFHPISFNRTLSKWEHEPLKSANAVLKCARMLAGSEFRESDYRALEVPSGSLVYCDPPYAGTSGYGGGFDSTEFWAWASALAEAGSSVFVSEYAAPSGVADVVWQKERKTGFGDTGKVKTERLFKVRGAVAPPLLG